MSKNTVFVYVFGSTRGCNRCLCVGLCEINRTCSGEWDSGQWTQLRRQLWGGGGEEGDRGGMEESRPSVEGRAPWQPPESEWDLSRPDRWTDRPTPRCHSHSPEATGSPLAPQVWHAAHSGRQKNGGMVTCWYREMHKERKRLTHLEELQDSGNLLFAQLIHTLLAHRSSSIYYTDIRDSNKKSTYVGCCVVYH